MSKSNLNLVSYLSNSHLKMTDNNTKDNATFDKYNNAYVYNNNNLYNNNNGNNSNNNTSGNNNSYVTKNVSDSGLINAFLEPYADSYAFQTQSLAYLNSQLPFNNPSEIANPFSKQFSNFYNTDQPASNSLESQYAEDTPLKRKMIDENNEYEIANKKFCSASLPFNALSGYATADSDNWCMKPQGSNVSGFSTTSVTPNHFAEQGYSKKPHTTPSAVPNTTATSSYDSSSQESARQKRRKREITKMQRNAANLRERKRMNKLNIAFDELWKKMPDYTFGHMSSHLSRHIKLSRVFILKSALSYIEHLTKQLDS